MRALCASTGTQRAPKNGSTKCCCNPRLASPHLASPRLASRTISQRGLSAKQDRTAPAPGRMASRSSRAGFETPLNALGSPNPRQGCSGQATSEHTAVAGSSTRMPTRLGVTASPHQGRDYQPRRSCISAQVRLMSQVSAVVGDCCVVDPTIINEPPSGVEPVHV